MQMDLIRRQQVQFFSPHSPADCVSRLRAAVNSEAFFDLSSWFGTMPVSGRVSESSLRLRKRIWYRNDFQSFLYATMQPETGGTVIFGKVGLHPFTTVFICIWLGVAVLMCGTVLTPSIRSFFAHPDAVHQETWVGCVVPIIMPVFGIGLVWFGRFLARNEDRFLTEFLVQTLDANKCDPT